MVDLLKNYLEKRIQLVKLELTGVLANVASGLVSSFLMFVFVILIVFMLSFALAFWFSELFENKALGFGLVGAIYLILFVLYISLFKEKIDIKVKDAVIKNAYKTEVEEIEKEN